MHTVVGVPPLSSSTPVRRSSPRLTVPADSDDNETGLCSSSAKPSYSTRGSLRRTVPNGAIVPTDSERNLTPRGGSNVQQAEHQHHLRNSAIKTIYSNLFSSRRSSLNDDKGNDVTPDANEPAPKRKRGWPKGVPRKKQVSYFLCDNCDNSIQLMVL